MVAPATVEACSMDASTGSVIAGQKRRVWCSGTFFAPHSARKQGYSALGWARRLPSSMMRTPPVNSWVGFCESKKG